MKTTKFVLLSAVSCLLIFLVSCSNSDELDHVDNNQSAINNVQVNEISEVERMTLVELNKELQNHGVEPITEEQIHNVREKRAAYLLSKGKAVQKSGTCYTAQYYGDWSRQSSYPNCNYVSTYVSSQDIILAQNYINDEGDGTTAPIGNDWNGYGGCTSDNFGVISYYNLGYGEYTVDQDDKAIVADFILGTCTY